MGKIVNLNPAELEVLNNRLNNLAKQVKALDSESRRIEYGKILYWASVAEVIAIGAHLSSVILPSSDASFARYATCYLVVYVENVLEQMATLFLLGWLSLLEKYQK